MPVSDAVIRNLYGRVKVLHARESELDLRLSQEISTALAHFGPSILALDGADPLDGDFIALYHQLALRRIAQFKQIISERTSYLNGSKTVQDTLHLGNLCISSQRMCLHMRAGCGSIPAYAAI